MGIVQEVYLPMKFRTDSVTRFALLVAGLRACANKNLCHKAKDCMICKISRAIRSSHIMPLENQVKVLLIGEHDKGLGEPFPEKTKSGNRLRTLIRQYRVSATIVNMMDCSAKKPKLSDLKRLCRHKKNHQATVFLGRRVERELKLHFPDGIYLPHPAARRGVDHIALEEGIAQFGEL